MKRRTGVKRQTAPAPTPSWEIENASDFRNLPKSARNAWAAFLVAYKVVLDEIAIDTAARGPITLPEFEILLYIAASPGERIRYLTLMKRTLLSASQVSRRISALIDRGYVLKVVDEADKRAAFAMLTDAGREAFAEAQAPFLSSLRRNFFARIPPQELDAFTAILVRLANDENFPPPG